jgi:hypothetical protein
MRVVISGSFKPEPWNFPHIQALGRHMRCIGWTVLQPPIAEVVNGGGFARLSTDEADKTPLELEQGYLDAISAADLLVVNNWKGGRIGFSAAAETAHALTEGTVVTTLFDEMKPSKAHAGLDRDEDLPSAWFGHEVLPSGAVIINRCIFTRPGVPGLYPNSGIYDSALLQNIRRFQQPTPDDIPILRGLTKRLMSQLEGVPAYA